MTKVALPDGFGEALESNFGGEELGVGWLESHRHRQRVEDSLEERKHLFPVHAIPWRTEEERIWKK